MKSIYIKLILVFLLSLTTNSCSVDNVVPLNTLIEDTVIRDEESAIAFLNRIYNTYRGPGLGGRKPLLDTAVTARLSAASQELVLGNPDFFGFDQHNVQPSASVLQEVYTQEYFTINNANFFIELIEAGNANISTERENELLAEARFFRGYSHFNLLRFFGQFYDLSSEFGIVTFTRPVRGAEAVARNTVQATYDLIIEDLEFVANNAQDSRPHYYITSTTARAALAKVQLYMGDYDAAATNALAVINNTDGYALVGDYADIFNTKYGPETLFAPFAGNGGFGSQEGNMSAFLYDNRFTFPSNYLKTLADAQDGIPGDGSTDNTTGYDPRFSFGFDQTAMNPKYPFLTPNQPGNTVNMLRMGEVYLIYAEAEARRAGGNLTNALNRLNDIRTRAGVAPKVLNSQDDLLADIRDEKLLELYRETGESWFDLVRYDRLNNIDATALIPTITNANQLIYPIPRNALTGNNLLVQNP